jgi:Flp pilus assembly protein TadD
MISRRAKQVGLGVALAGGIAGVSWVAWHKDFRSAPASPNVAVTQFDLSRWPPAFKAELEAAIAEVNKQPSSPEALARLAQLYAANDFTAEAEQKLTKLREAEPTNARWAYFLGTLLARRGELEGAERQFRETLRLAPDYSSAAFQLGQLLAGRGRDAEARSFYEQRLENVPSDTLATLGLVEIARRTGNHDIAIERLERHLKVNPAAGETRLLLAEMLESAGRTQEAEQHRRAMHNKGVATPPQDPWLDELYLFSFDTFRLQTLGMLHLQANDSKKAMPYLQRAATLSPLDPDAQTSLAQCLVATGQLDEARTVLEEAIQRMPQEPILTVRLGDLLLQQGHEAHASKVLLEGLKNHPSSPEINDALGRMSYRAGRYSDAILSFSEALRLSPVMTETRLNLGRALGAAGRRTEARAAIAQAVEMRPASVDGLLLLARVDLEDDNIESAQRLGARLLELDPGSRVVQQLYEQIIQRRVTAALQKGDTGAAERIHREAVESAPAIGPLHGNLGAFLAKQARMSEAVVPFERYTELSPQDPRAWLFLGTALRELGRTEAATKALTRGLEAARAMGDTQRVLLIEQVLQQR